MITTNDILQKIRDDLLLTGKQLIMDNLPENKNALFIGKFRIPTKAHMDIISDAIDKYNHVVVCVVKSKKKHSESLDLESQINIFETVFGNKLTIITHSTGNLTSIINKSPKRIKYLLTGSDRLDSYKQQLIRHPNLDLVEIKRDLGKIDNISATKVIESLKNDDIKQFKQMMHKKIWKKYKELQGKIK